MPVKMKREKPIDWAEIVMSLIRAKVNISTISKEIGVAYQSVAQWRDGVSKPNYDHGCGLTGLWMMTLRLDHTKIPRTGQSQKH